MPVIAKSAFGNPLPPEGHYAGICRKVSFSYNQEGVGVMRVPLHSPNGELIATAMLVDTHTRNWAFPALIRSTELRTPSDGDQYTLDPSDVEGLVAYFEVTHFTLQTGRTIASVKFHTKNWTILRRPELADTKFPGARPPGMLRATSLGPDGETLTSTTPTTATAPAADSPSSSSSTATPAIAPASNGPVAPVVPSSQPTGAPVPATPTNASPAATPSVNPLAELNEVDILAALEQLRKSKDVAVGK
jgi:hypothetical protein